VFRGVRNRATRSDGAKGERVRPTLLTHPPRATPAVSACTAGNYISHTSLYKLIRQKKTLASQ
jgi:hypothetical protein